MINFRIGVFDGVRSSNPKVGTLFWKLMLEWEAGYISRQ
jgi:hypothetical protein